MLYHVISSYIIYYLILYILYIYIIICRYIYIHIYMIIIQYQDNDVGLPIFLIIYYDKDLLHDWIFPSKASSDRNFVDQSIESLEI